MLLPDATAPCRPPLHCRYGVAGFVFTLLFASWLLPKDTGSRPREDLLLAAAVGPGSSVSVAAASLVHEMLGGMPRRT